MLILTRKNEPANLLTQIDVGTSNCTQNALAMHIFAVGCRYNLTINSYFMLLSVFLRNNSFGLAHYYYYFCRLVNQQSDVVQINTNILLCWYVYVFTLFSVTSQYFKLFNIILIRHLNVYNGSVGNKRCNIILFSVFHKIL